MDQPSLFNAPTHAAVSVAPEQLVLFAFGEFQTRGKVLAGRELPLDRLRGALRRAADVLGVEALDDEATAAACRRLGAHVTQVPPFVAKHPFRVGVDAALAAQALKFYRETVLTRADDEGRSRAR